MQINGESNAVAVQGQSCGQSASSLEGVDPCRTPTPAVGNRVHALWGAMFPDWTGTVIATYGNGDVLIEWDEIWESEPSRETIRFERSANGSPVGVYLDSHPLPPSR